MSTPQERLEGKDPEQLGKTEFAIPVWIEGSEVLQDILDALLTDRDNATLVVPRSVVPQTGQQSIPASGGEGEFKIVDAIATGIFFDIPENMDATLSLNGKPILQVSDSGGRSGSFGGNLPAGHLILIEELKLTVTNNDGSASDVGLWINEPIFTQRR